MFYIVFAIVVVAIGAWNINPMVEWLDNQNWPRYLKSTIMITLMGVIPAIAVGFGIIADTLWGRDRRAG